MKQSTPPSDHELSQPRAEWFSTSEERLKNVMKICLIHAHRPSREIIARALRRSLDAHVTTFSCCEDALMTSLDYEVCIVYNNFGRKKMGGGRGVAKIRDLEPKACIIGVTPHPSFKTKFLSAGANACLLRAGNEIKELRQLVEREFERSKKSDFRQKPAHPKK